MISQTNITPDTPMGATLVPGGAVFRAWAPRATSVYLNVWRPGLERGPIPFAARSCAGAGVMSAIAGESISEERSALISSRTPYPCSRG